MCDAITDRWQRRSLSSLGEYENGFAFNELHWSEHGLPIVRIAQITGSQGIADRYPGQLPDRFRIDSGDLIFSWSGTLAVVRWNGGPAWLNQHLFKVVPATGVEGSLLFHLLQASVAEMDKRTHGSTMKHIKRGELHEFFVSLPVDVGEQRKIAYVLDTLDTAIHETEAIIAKLKAVKQGLLHDLLTRGISANGELRPPQAEAPHLYKPSPLGWMPKDWAAVGLNDLVDPNRPIVYGILMPGYGRPGGIPVVKVKDIVDGRIQLDNLLLTSPQIDREYRRSRLRSGDLLFTIRGSVGRTALVPPTLDEANITQDTARLAIKGADSRFVRAYLQTSIPTRFVAVHTLGVAVQGINLRDVRRIPIARPPACEASEIANRLEAISKRSDHETRNFEKLKLTKAGLMDDLLTGRVRVTPLLEGTAPFVQQAATQFIQQPVGHPGA